MPESTAAARPLSADTPLDVERIWLDLQRQRGPLWRLRRAVELTSLCWRAAQEAVRRAHPDATPQERDRILLAHRYGDDSQAAACYDILELVKTSQPPL